MKRWNCLVLGYLGYLGPNVFLIGSSQSVKALQGRSRGHLDHFKDVPTGFMGVSMGLRGFQGRFTGH